MSEQKANAAVIQVWRDSVLKVDGKPVHWVVLVERNLVKQTLNPDRKQWFTDPVEAVLFAASEAKSRGIGWDTKIRQR